MPITVSVHDRGRRSLGGSTRIGLVGVCSGVADGSVVEVLKTNFETTLERGPGLVQARDFFNHGGERLVFCGADQSGASGGTDGTCTLDGSGLATVVEDATEKPLFTRSPAMLISRALNDIGRPGSTMAKFAVDGSTFSESEFLLAVTSGDGDATSPYKTRVYIEDLQPGGLPFVGTAGNGPYWEFTEDTTTPGSSFLVGDIWQGDTTAYSPTQANILSAAQALADWRDAYGLQVSERQGALIGVSPELDATSWDNLNGIAQDAYDTTANQSFVAFVGVANQADQTSVQDDVDRVTTEVSAYRAALGTDKPWSEISWLWAKFDDGYGNITPRPAVGYILGLLAADGIHVERSFAWRAADRALHDGIAVDPAGLTVDQLEQLAANRVPAMVLEPGLGFYAYCDYLPAQPDSKLLNLRYLRSVNYAATVAILRSRTYQFAPGTDGKAKADQENYINDELRRLVEAGVFREATFKLGDALDPEAERLTFAGTITVKPVGSREAYSYDLYLDLS